MKASAGKSRNCMMQRVLLKARADVNARMDVTGGQALHVVYSEPKVVPLLVAANADLEARMSWPYSSTPLQSAAFFNAPEARESGRQTQATAHNTF